MAEVLLPGAVTAETAESEFESGLTGACGPNACSAAGRWSDQDSRTNSTDNTVSMNYWLQKIVSSPNGVSTLSELEAMMRLLKYELVLPNQGESALAFANRMLWGQIGAVVMFYDAAQALQDFITGAGMDASNLHGHFNCLFGRNSGGVSERAGGKVLPAGYWVSDGDNGVQNPIINGARVHRGINTELVYYPDSLMVAGGASSAFAVKPRKVLSVSVPSGWKDDGTVLTAPNAVPITLGFREEVLNWPGGWESLNVPLEAAQSLLSVEPGNPAIGAGTRQDFRWRSLGWTSSKGVYVIWVGQDVLALEKEVSDLKAQLAAVPPPVDNSAVIADLHDALTKLGG